MLKPIATEKSVMKIEIENTLTFESPRKVTKIEIGEEFEEMFKVKAEKIRTFIRGNKKYAYIKLKKEFPAIDIATKLGLM